ncbi:transcriptional regulator, TetR family [Goodfellowiella coeruleoviolacea]|uniref:Transcriptional regulator, TetR family n=2 Tax=Goodfellowiella coeruleoviolacea TaxID=334858 RepID=A0AAE3GC30_9PSEU|nr:transcriptional regulator, TetR family [Goodfellowiella coeruleoviolacea]
MSVEQRRDAIAQATLPLLAEHGADVTTSQIARAAGIAEGTVFRAFRDKQELIGYCLQVALRVDPELDRIAAISPDLPLAERLAQALETITGYQTRVWQVLAPLRQARFQPRRDEDGTDTDEHAEAKGPQAQMQRLAGATTELIRPDADRLRIPPERAALLLIGLMFADRISEQLGEPLTPPAQLVDLFLHGVTTTGAPPTTTPPTGGPTTTGERTP